MVHDTLWLRLFDDKKTCQFIRPLKTVVNEKSGRWYLSPRKVTKIVFTASKKMVVTHGTIESELIQKTFPHVSMRVPNVSNVRMTAGSTLTLRLGGLRGTTKLLELS